MDAQQDPSSHLTKWTDQMSEIQKLDKEPWWQLKAICAKNSLKLYMKYLTDNTSKKNQSGKNRQKTMLGMNDQQFSIYTNWQREFIKEFNN